MEQLVECCIWNKVSVEVEGPFPKTKAGNQYIVILTDLSSKWIEAKPLEQKDARSIALFVATSFARFGLCEVNFVNLNDAFELDVRTAIYTQCSTFLGSQKHYQPALEKLRTVQRTFEAGDKSFKRCFHTNKLLEWIGDHVDNWDVELEGHLFQLRTAAPGADQQSPFALMHGGRRQQHQQQQQQLVVKNEPPISPVVDSHRVRRTPRKILKSNIDPKDLHDAVSGNEVDIVKSTPPPCGIEHKRGRGRPRKNKTPMRIKIIEVASNEERRLGCKLKDVIASNINYNLRGRIVVHETRRAKTNVQVAVDKQGNVPVGTSGKSDSNLTTSKDDAVESTQDKVTCSKCPALHCSEKEILLHQAFHKNGSKLLHCIYCTYVCSTWEHIQDHLKQHVENKITEPAYSQTKKMIRRNELAGSQPYRCSKCVNVKMATKEEFKIHLNCHKTESKLLHCPYCATVCGMWQQMQYHLGSHPEVPLEVHMIPLKSKTCSKCSRVFPNPEAVYEHQMIFHVKDRRFQCETCGKTFKERKSILRHQELHANITYRCSDCPYKTKIRYDFLQHQLIHTGKGHACEFCGKAFARQSQLSLHLESHRKDRGVAICDQCGHQSNGRTALWHHVRSAHRERKSWPCPQCQYVGNTRSNLRGHTDRIHNKRFKCPQCDFGCLAESTLLKHLDMFHNDELRRYPCLHCRYRAKEPKCLAEHMRVFHNPNAQKFPCEYCKAKFKTKSMLRDHMPQHTGQRFVCKVCGYIAKYRSVLYRHMKKRHSEIKFTPNIRRKNVKTASRRHKAISENGQVATTSGLCLETAIVVEVENEQMIEDGGDVLVAANDLLQFNAEGMEGEPIMVDGNSILLHASMFGQSPSADGTITLPSNMYLQIISHDKSTENIVMQVCPMQEGDDDDDDDGDHKPLELLLVSPNDTQE